MAEERIVVQRNLSYARPSEKSNTVTTRISLLAVERRYQFKPTWINVHGQDSQILRSI